MVCADTHFRGSLRQALEDILKLMLHVWCKGAVAVKVVSAKPSECDKTVVVRRQSGEFGFRIHGSRPVVVSAIEPDTPAETSGLEVGDIIISVNNVNVLDASHSEVVKIAHAGSDTLELEVARTCNVLTPVVREPGAGSPLYSGYLWKLGGLSNGAKWVQRWFCLKRDNCLYYYKNDIESQPLGAVMLMNYSVSRTPDSGRLYSFILDKTGATGLHLAADDEESAMRWLAVISHSIERNAQVWHACTATECKTLLPEESGLHLRSCPLNLAKDTTTSIQIQKWTRRGGWQHWSTPLIDGSKWADASASDVGLTRNPVIAIQPSWATP